MSISRDKMAKELTGLFVASLDCMSYEEIEKLHKETFDELKDRIEQHILFGDQKGEQT